MEKIVNPWGIFCCSIADAHNGQLRVDFTHSTPVPNLRGRRRNWSHTSPAAARFGALDLCLFGHLQSVINLDAQVPYSAFEPMSCGA
jgi:hypothetical protein